MISTFLKYYESKIEDNGIAKFKSINGDIEELEYELIADSVYDQTFKRIFDWNLIIDGISGEDRLKHLLNCLFFS